VTTKFCTSCGGSLQDCDQFCSSCGAASAPAPFEGGSPVLFSPPVQQASIPPTAEVLGRIRRDRAVLYIIVGIVVGYLALRGGISLVKFRAEEAGIERQKVKDAAAEQGMADYFRSRPSEPAKPEIPWNGKGADPNFPVH
jgi:hypothetical protein